MTSQISPLHRGATRFLNPSRDCCSFSIEDIGVKDVFSLSSCEGFNLGSCFVGSSTYFSTCFVLPNPRECRNSKKICLQSSRNFPKLPLQLPLKRERPIRFQSSWECGNHRNGFPNSWEQFSCNRGFLQKNYKKGEV